MEEKLGQIELSGDRRWGIACQRSREEQGMQERTRVFLREELYERVWTRPTQAAAGLGVVPASGR
jgi:hypothetical protein